MRRALHTFWESLTGGSRRLPRALRALNVGMLSLGIAIAIVILASVNYCFGYTRGLFDPTPWHVRVDTGRFIYATILWHPEVGTERGWFLESNPTTAQQWWVEHGKSPYNIKDYGDVYGDLWGVSCSLVHLTLILLAIPGITMAFYFVRKRRRA